jgi:hypothetical protein
VAYRLLGWVLGLPRVPGCPCAGDARGSWVYSSPWVPHPTTPRSLPFAPVGAACVAAAFLGGRLSVPNNEDERELPATVRHPRICASYNVSLQIFLVNRIQQPPSRRELPFVVATVDVLYPSQTRSRHFCRGASTNIMSTNTPPPCPQARVLFRFSPRHNPLSPRSQHL